MELAQVINQREGKTRLQLTINVALADSLESHAGKDNHNHAEAYKAVARELLAHGNKLAKEAAEIFEAEKKAAEAKAKQ